MILPGWSLRYMIRTETRLWLVSQHDSRSIKALGITTPIAIGENEYDDLFVVQLGEKPG